MIQTTSADKPRIKPAYFFVAAAISGLVTVSALRANNLQMVKLRSAVYSADKDNGDVNAALKSLQLYVTGHMNTDLTPGKNAVTPPIQLKYTYERLQAAANGGISNDQIYSDAQAYCEIQNSSDFSGRNRIPCIQDYVTSHTPAAAQTVPDSLYKFDFVSPSWSPDLAGWGLVVTAVLLLAAITLLVVRRLARLLKRSKRSSNV